MWRIVIYEIFFFICAQIKYEGVRLVVFTSSLIKLITNE